MGSLVLGVQIRRMNCRALLIAISVWVVRTLALADDSWEAVDPMPSRFPVVRDRLGYSWPLTTAGSFYSSGGNVFDAANQLTIDGERFTAEKVQRRGARHAFLGHCGTVWAVRREVWIDAERAAAVHLEEVTNTTPEARAILLEVTTHFRTAWRTWSARDGLALVASTPQPGTGAFLSFPPREGDSDLFFLLGDGQGQVTARIDADVAAQTFTARFACEVAPGAMLRIAHLTGQRRPGPAELAGAGAGAEPFAPFFEDGRLELPGLSGAVANFGAALAATEDSVVWTGRNGDEWRLTEPCPISVELIGALGRWRVRADEVLSFDGRIWKTRDGARIRAVALPGQVLPVKTSSGSRSIALEDLGGIRSPGEWEPAADGLRLKNGDIWPGRCVKETADLVTWEWQGRVSEVPRSWQNEK